MEQDIFTGQDSFRLINQMIETAKQEQKDDGSGWISWGWLIFAASLFTFLNMQFDWLPVFIFWNVFGLITLLYFIYQISRHSFSSKAEKVKTYTGELFKKLNTGFFIFLTLIIVSINTGVPPAKGFALLLGLYGFWMLIYGTALNFFPSTVGAYITWGIAFICLFIPAHRFDLVMLLHALAALCGYIIPGYMARKAFHKINQPAGV